MTSVTRLARNPAVTTRDLEGERFLVQPENGEIFHLDGVTSRVWQLLERPRPAGEIARTLAAAVPEDSAASCRSEVERLLAELLEAGLLRRS